MNSRVFPASEVSHCVSGRASYRSANKHPHITYSLFPHGTPFCHHIHSLFSQYVVILKLYLIFQAHLEHVYMWCT